MCKSFTFTVWTQPEHLTQATMLICSLAGFGFMVGPVVTRIVSTDISQNFMYAGLLVS